MIGQLPQSLKVCGHDYEIRSDYRNILTIITAYNDGRLTDKEKAFICLYRVFKDVNSLPRSVEGYTAAIQAATDFIECRLSNDKPSPKVVNWQKDEQLIFPAINKVAGTEVRMLPYLHWWTFLGYFQAIDRDDLWGFILAVRQKQMKHKKLEKYEQEFLIANRELCSVEYLEDQKKPEDALRAIYEELLKEGGTSKNG